MNNIKSHVDHVCLASSFITERLHSYNPVTPVDRNQPEIRKILSDLNNACPNISGNIDGWLKLNQYDYRSFINIFSTNNYRPCQPEPLHDDLSGLFRTISKISTEYISQNKLAYTFIDPDNPVLCEELLVPFVVFASKILLDDSESRYHSLSTNVRTRMESDFLGNLSRISSETYLKCFLNFRQSGQPGKFALNNNGNKHIYRSFISQNLSTRAIYIDYSLLTRLLAQRTRFWIDYIKSLLKRIDSDYGKYRTLFGGEPESPVDTTWNTIYSHITSISPHHSDSHDNGQTVAIIEFTGTRKIIYKPKALGVEIAFSEFIDWINTQGTSCTLRTARCIDLGDYGWAEYIDHTGCDSIQQVEQFYHRSGMMLAIVYALKGGDYIHDNIIASSGHPILIDNECLMTIDIMSEIIFPDAQENSAYRDFSNSILSTKLIPLWQPAANGELSCISGLSCSALESTSKRTFRLTGINTDNIAPEHHQKSLTGESKNIPLLDSRPQFLNGSLASFKHGFREIYALLLKNRALLLSDDGPLSCFHNKRIRILFRRTSTYTNIINRSLSDNNAANAIDYEVAQENLSCLYLSSKILNRFPSLYREEKKLLMQLDIPKVTMVSDSDLVKIADTEIPMDIISESLLCKVKKRIESLATEDMNKQLKIIDRACFLFERKEMMGPDFFKSIDSRI